MKDMFHLCKEDVHEHHFFLNNDLYAEEFELIWSESFLVPSLYRYLYLDFPESCRMTQVNGEKQLGKETVKQKNVKVFAISENFEGWHSKSFTCLFSQRKADALC